MRACARVRPFASTRATVTTDQRHQPATDVGECATRDTRRCVACRRTDYGETHSSRAHAHHTTCARPRPTTHQSDNSKSKRTLNTHSWKNKGKQKKNQVNFSSLNRSHARAHSRRLSSSTSHHALHTRTPLTPVASAARAYSALLRKRCVRSCWLVVVEAFAMCLMFNCERNCETVLVETERGKEETQVSRVVRAVKTQCNDAAWYMYMLTAIINSA